MWDVLEKRTIATLWSFVLQSQGLRLGWDASKSRKDFVSCSKRAKWGKRAGITSCCHCCHCAARLRRCWPGLAAGTGGVSSIGIMSGSSDALSAKLLAATSVGDIGGGRHALSRSSVRPNWPRREGKRGWMRVIPPNSWMSGRRAMCAGSLAKW
jgi:hypothetical protein